MALTSRERSRRFREKLKNDPLRLAEYQEKDRKRYHENKDLIKEKTNRGKRRERKKWRLLNRPNLQIIKTMKNYTKYQHIHVKRFSKKKNRKKIKYS